MPLSSVSIKATTTEKLGFVGRAEGLAAQAAATIRLPEVTAELERRRRDGRAPLVIDDPALLARAEALVAAYAAAGLTVATAESCTGGLVAGLLTAIPGSSAVVERGFVTYSNAAKTESSAYPPTSSPPTAP